MPVEFVGREVEVCLSDGDPPVPLAFNLRGRDYKVAEQIATWQDQAFGSLGRGRDWRQQQRRQHYRLRTEDGEVYELYADWLPSRRQRKGGGKGARWYVHRRLSGAAASEEGGEPKPTAE